MKEKIIQWIWDNHDHLDINDFKDWEAPYGLKTDMAYVDSIALEKFINNL